MLRDKFDALANIFEVKEVENNKESVSRGEQKYWCLAIARLQNHKMMSILHGIIENLL
jgi:hypothetical protein